MSTSLVPGFQLSKQDKQWIWSRAELPPLVAADFDLAAWQSRGGAEPAAGRGSACRIQRQGAEWFLRHYRRGGLVGKLLHDQYLWRGLANTRVVREIVVTDALYRQGFAVPRVMGGRLLKSGCIYRADLITEALPCKSSMADALATLTTAQWAAIGACIAKFHQQGLWHADLNAHNIQLADEQVWLIDFDRAEFRDPSPAWQQQNLQRLWRSVCKLSGGEEHAPQQAWAQLINAYEQAK